MNWLLQPTERLCHILSSKLTDTNNFNLQQQFFFFSECDRLRIMQTIKSEGPIHAAIGREKLLTFRYRNWVNSYRIGEEMRYNTRCFLPLHSAQDYLYTADGGIKRTNRRYKIFTITRIFFRSAVGA